LTAAAICFVDISQVVSVTSLTQNTKHGDGLVHWKFLGQKLTETMIGLCPSMTRQQEPWIY